MEPESFSTADLCQLDYEFKKAIQSGDAPFLGVQKNFTPHIRGYIHEQLTKSKNPLTIFNFYITKWPAVTLTYLTLYVSEGFGEHGTFEVYPFIEKALGVENLTQQQKEKLWESFRRKCLALGLSVSSRLSGTHYMVGEYLRQAGVPLKYTPELTDKMLRYANNVGLPDEDDTSAVKLWQQGLCESLKVPFPKTVRKAVEADDTNYITLLFLKLLSQPVIQSNEDDFETIMSKAIYNRVDRATRAYQQKGHGITIPQVVWRDQQLGVELPPGESHSWRIMVGDSETEFQGMLESRFTPFDEDLPIDVQIDHSSGGISRKLKLWENQKNNRILIFSHEGILVCGAQLGMPQPVTLEPGEYQIVSRFIPDGKEDDVEEVYSDPDIFEFNIFLEPGENLPLTRGPATLKIVADSKPLLIWKGNSAKGVRGNEIFCSIGTVLKVIIPSELLMNGEAKYTVRLTPGNLGESVEIPVTGSDADDRHIVINIEEQCRHWNPGVIRLLAEIRRDGVQRAVLRSAIYLWNGLERVENRTLFYCADYPTNLMPDDCDNLLVDREKSLLTYRNDDNRFFRMVFNLGDNKRLTYTSVVPGIFMQLKDYNNSHVTERVLRKGMILSVAANSRSVLEIHSTSNGSLRLGTYQKFVDFNGCGCKRIPLSGLIEYLGPNSDTLQFFSEGNQIPEDLIKLIAPHEVLDFSVNQAGDQFQIFFSLPEQSIELKMTALNIVSGQRETLNLGCNHSMERTFSNINGWLTSEFNREGIHVHELRIMLRNWPDGAWLLDFEININGRWGSLSNSRGDDFGSGFIIERGRISIGYASTLNEFKELGLEEKLTIFRRIHELLLRCYAPEAWSNIEWLKDLWSKLADEFQEKEHYATRLIALADRSAPETASKSWVPMLSLSFRCLWLYALPIQNYQGVSSKTHSHFQKCLCTMNSIEYGLLEMMKQAILHQIFAMGFENIIEMQQGEEPKHFNMKRYEVSLKTQNFSERLRLLQEDDWRPGDGDYLGALHYLYAKGNLKQNYNDTLQGNDFRRGKAQFLCRTIFQSPLKDIICDFDNGIGSLIINMDSDSSGDDLSIDQEILVHITHFLSVLALICRMESRKKGGLQKFIYKSKQIIEDNRQFDSIFGYLLYIGKDVFGFYLLLWEAILTADYTTGE